VHTVRYHLERALAIHRPRTEREPNISEIDRLLEQVRLTPAENFRRAYPHELSGGQRQRISIARALAASPRVLLADEPVSMLDVSIRLEVLDLIAELRSSLQLAILYITHDIASARYFSDEILVMHAGEIVERGPAEEVTQRPAHPYTQLLVSSAPDPDNLGGRPAAERTSARAFVGPAAAGCPFRPRCPFADDRCRRENPALMRISATRGAACWHLDAAAPGLVSGAPGGGDPTTS
jgi:peptide/nickel transport system ATP-binding protein